MKYKAVEAAEPIKTKKSGWWTTTQMVKNILVLNVFHNKILHARHAVNVDTREFATWQHGVWSNTKVESAYDVSALDYRYWRYGHNNPYMRMKMSEKDREIIRDIVKKHCPYVSDGKDAIEALSNMERDFGRDKRELAEHNRYERVKAMMGRVPEIPEGIREWIDQRATGGMNYCIKDNDTKLWTCTACGKTFPPDKIPEQNIRNNDMVTCPKCGEKIRYLSRKRRVEFWEHFQIIQPIDDEISVSRHFGACVTCDTGCRKSIRIWEDIRIILFKHPAKLACDLYYHQYRDEFDNKSNPHNKREYPGYLYDGGIEEALKDTVYEPWTMLFSQFAAAGLALNYNKMLIAWENESYRGIIEMLFRGRFYKLLAEESNAISNYSGGYTGNLHLYGQCIEDVFDIGDRQKLNRIREKNGGALMVKWMRWSESQKQKISDKALEWLQANDIEPNGIAWMKDHFTVEQIMNYIERQRKESYKGKNAKQVISQYEDYMRMCEQLHKDTSDEMVYRPRELKRRHDEAVKETELRRAEIKAEEYSKKFSEAEAVLGEIREKFEYTGQQYFIMVPQRIVDIVREGNALHHCAGSTDRYFDRIKQHETYICFCRKVEEPDTPYYTIEVEPGGTIRQHRGLFDEEPEIEEVKPFLKEWQKVIRSRMREEDHRLAELSKVKRLENIAELKAKNNTRVLEGLMEDFMEALEQEEESGRDTLSEVV